MDNRTGEFPHFWHSFGGRNLFFCEIALLTALVKDERRGSLMSLTVALGQVGFALGGVVAGPLFAGVGFVSNAALSAVFVLIMGVVVWRFIPEPEAQPVPVPTGTGAPSTP